MEIIDSILAKYISIRYKNGVLKFNLEDLKNMLIMMDYTALMSIERNLDSYLKDEEE